MRRKTQKARQDSRTVKLVLTIAVCAVAAFLVGMTAAEESKGVPRYDKHYSQCKNFRPCVLDVRRRARCYRTKGVAGRECYIRYAARFYNQNASYALKVAKCESYPWLAYWLTSPMKGMWQFEAATWRGLPWSIERHGPHSVKYSSLGAMWYWKRGQSYRWTQCL